MKNMHHSCATCFLATFFACNTYAIDSFSPLTAPATLSNTNESTTPFLLPEGWTQTLVTDRTTLDSQGLPSTFSSWDMIDIGGVNSEYIYIPMEVQTGAGVIRYSRDTGDYTTLLQGNNNGVFKSDPTDWSATNDDFGSLDPAVKTPSGSLVTAEEGSGNGRMFEISNPDTATGTDDASVQWLSNIPSVSHEGIKFDSVGRMYFVDENNSGSIYRFTPNTPGDLTSGSVDVLSVSAFAGHASANFNSSTNLGHSRTGDSTWVKIVDSNGTPTTTADPFNFMARGGRSAADEVNATPYGRPEDMVIATVNGEEILYFATTSENIIYGLNLTTGLVFESVNSTVTPDSLGNTPVGTGANDSVYGLDDPDNLEFSFSANGELQLFIIEDGNPGDIWMATDINGDGVADVVDLFASLGPFGSEPSGFIADPRGGFLVNIQHPDSGNEALWRISQVSSPSSVWIQVTGTAQGGLVFFTVAGVTLSVTTTNGLTTEQVIQAMADAVKNNVTLSAMGVTALAVGDTIYINNQLTHVTKTDPGLILSDGFGKPPMDGDINLDGTVNVVDILLGQQVLINAATLSPEQFTHGDVAPLVEGLPDPDGEFTLGDLLIIERKALGMISF